MDTVARALLATVHGHLDALAPAACLPCPAEASVRYTGRMTTTEQILAAALELSAEERDRLVDSLLVSLEQEASPLTAEERAELDRRLDAYRRDPAAASSWEDVKARLLGAG
jgi:putative addiction module component (TIGR02574 family)